MSKATRTHDDRNTRLRLAARLNGGIIPVPFLGTTWQTRRAPYWWRRIGASFVFLLLLAVVGAMAVGFTIGIIGDGHDVIRVIFAVLYALTALLGVRTALHMIADAPVDDRVGTPRTFAANGLLALVLAPFGTGLVLTFLLASFGRDFIGERTARQASEAR
jgi:hypothetical protein